MNVGGWALRHRTLVLLTTLALVVGGILAARGLASGIYPEVDFPRIGVVVRQGDAPPAVFQTNVVRPIEEALMTVLGVQRVRSRTIRGGAEIALLFAADADMWRALQLVDSSLADIRPSLPAGTLVRVERLSPVSFPILSFNLVGPEDARVLHELAEFTLRPALSRVQGVGHVGVLGGDVREMQVIVDAARAGAAHLRLEDVAARIRRALPLLAVGRYEQDRSLITVMASAEATNAGDLASVPVGVDASGAPLLLGQVAQVEEGAEDRFFRASGPRGDSVLLTIARLEGASTPDVVQRVLASVATLRASLPPGVSIEPVYDQGWLVSAAIGSVREAILIGIGLCLVVLGVFLKDVRAGFVAAVAVPTTLVITFLAMQALRQSMNLMSLGGMAVSIGLVVDDAIVIVEAIARRLEHGDDPETAAVVGTRALSGAVVGTTITTVIVFLPLAFLRGVVGKFFGALATTLSASVLISLFVALFLVPILAARIMRERPASDTPSSFERRVGGLIAWSARHAWLGVVGLSAACLVSYFAIDHVPSGFMPACDEGAFVIDYDTPAGSSLTETDAAARRIEAILKETPEVLTFSRRSGAQINPTAVTLLNRGDLAVRLRAERTRHADAVMNELRERIAREVPGLRVEFIQILQDMLNDLSGAPHPIEIKVFGEDYAELARIAQDAARRIEHVPGLVDLFDGVERPSPQLVLDIDRSAVTRLGFAPQDVAQEVSNALLGTQAGTIRRFDRTIGIRVRYPDAVRYAPERLAQLPLAFGAAGTLNLSSVARLRKDTSPTVLFHEGLEPVVLAHADHAGRDLGSVARDVEHALKRVKLPPGYRIEIGGQYAEQLETTRNLLLIAGGGLLLVLVVLVAQFGRLSSALAVILTAPLAVVGALLTLWASNKPLNASSMMGCVLLIGLVVKNGILLLELAQAFADKGTPYAEALRAAGERRIRPIAMTTLATLFGLLPLAFALGAGAELQQPLAIAVIGGLATSTLLSLVLLPALAAALHRLLPLRAPGLEEPAPA